MCNDQLSLQLHSNSGDGSLLMAAHSLPTRLLAALCGTPAHASAPSCPRPCILLSEALMQQAAHSTGQWRGRRQAGGRGGGLSNAGCNVADDARRCSDVRCAAAHRATRGPTLPCPFSLHSQRHQPPHSASRALVRPLSRAPGPLAPRRASSAPPAPLLPPATPREREECCSAAHEAHKPPNGSRFKKVSFGRFCCCTGSKSFSTGHGPAERRSLRRW